MKNDDYMSMDGTRQMSQHVVRMIERNQGQRAKKEQDRE